MNSLSAYEQFCETGAIAAPWAFAFALLWQLANPRGPKPPSQWWQNSSNDHPPYRPKEERRNLLLFASVVCAAISTFWVVRENSEERENYQSARDAGEKVSAPRYRNSLAHGVTVLIILLGFGAFAFQQQNRPQMSNEN